MRMQLALGRGWVQGRWEREFDSKVALLQAPRLRAECYLPAPNLALLQRLWQLVDRYLRFDRRERKMDGAQVLQDLRPRQRE